MLTLAQIKSIQSVGEEVQQIFQELIQGVVGQANQHDGLLVALTATATTAKDTGGKDETKPANGY